MKPQDSAKKKKPTKNNLFDYGRYTSIAFEMVAIITAGVAGGHYLDIFLNIGFPVFTLFLSVLSVVLAIYMVIKDFIHPK